VFLVCPPYVTILSSCRGMLRCPALIRHFHRGGGLHGWKPSLLVQFRFFFSPQDLFFASVFAKITARANGANHRVNLAPLSFLPLLLFLFSLMPFPLFYRRFPPPPLVIYTLLLHLIVKGLPDLSAVTLLFPYHAHLTRSAVPPSVLTSRCAFFRPFALISFPLERHPTPLIVIISFDSELIMVSVRFSLRRAVSHMRCTSAPI